MAGHKRHGQPVEPQDDVMDESTFQRAFATVLRRNAADFEALAAFDRALSQRPYPTFDDARTPRLDDATEYRKAVIEVVRKQQKGAEVATEDGDGPAKRRRSKPTK